MSISELDWGAYPQLMSQINFFDQLIAKLPPLTDTQKHIKDNLRRFNLLRLGRRCGKTFLAREIILIEAFKKPGNYFWFFPTFRQAEEVGFASLVQIVSDLLPKENISTGRLRIQLLNGSFIYCVGAENYNSYRGWELNGAVIDEAREIDPKCFTEVVRPAIAKSKGWVIWASTPNGFDHFHRLWNQAEGNDWAKFHFTSFDNPHISKSELESMRVDMSLNEFNQEILAEFVKNDGQVFRNLLQTAIITSPDIPENHESHELVAGIDLAQMNDFSVLTGLCCTCGKVIDWQRFNHVEFSYQRDRIIEFHKKWDFSQIIVEANSIGKPNIELLIEAGLPIVPFTTTAQNKGNLIRRLVTTLEQGTLLIPRDYLGEFQAFSATKNKNGFMTYNGAHGNNDDRVMSTALANWARSNGQMGILLI